MRKQNRLQSSENNHMGQLWNRIITAHIYIFSEVTTSAGCPTFMAAKEQIGQSGIKSDRVYVGRRMIDILHFLCEAKSQQVVILLTYEVK